MRTATILTLLGTLLLGAAAGCDDSSVGTEPSPVGEYDLVLLGGSPLPVVTDIRGSVVTRLIEGSLAIRADQGCNDQFIFAEAEGDEEPTLSTVTSVCTWERTGNTVVLRRPNGSVESALIQGRRLVLGSGAFELTFER